MARRLIITVGQDGTVRAETKGVFGSACLDDVALLEDLLDATTAESRFTEDYHRVTDPAAAREAAVQEQREQGL